MKGRDIAVAAGVFVAIVALIVGTAAAGSIALPQDSTGTNSASIPSSFEAGSTSVDTSEASGEVVVSAESSGDVVVIDTAHGNDQSSEKVQTLERVLVESGYSVRYHGSAGASNAASGPGAGSGFGSSDEEPDLNESLRGADAYLIVNPSTPYDAQDTAGVSAFADAGGRVLIMSDPGSLGLVELLARSLGAGGSGSPDALAPVSSQFGVGVGSGYLYNMAEYDANYQTIYASGHRGSLSEGVDRVSVHRAAPVVAGPSATVGLTTSPETELSDSGVAEQYAVAARNGNVSIVGDTSVLDPARLQHADNEVFVGNLVEFLVGGTVQPDALEPSESSDSTKPGQMPGQQPPVTPKASGGAS